METNGGAPTSHPSARPRRRGQRLATPAVAVLAVVGSLGAVLAVAAPAGATGSSTFYASPSGTGDCTSAADACSLAQALAAADTASGEVVVSLATGTYDGQFTVADATGASLTIEGTATGSGSAAATVLDGQAAGTTLKLTSTMSAPVALEDLEVTGGSNPGGDGGGIADLGAGTLTLTDVLVTGNSVDGAPGAPGTPGTPGTPGGGGDPGGQAGDGGGIYVAGGALALTDATVSGNSADGGEGGLGGEGGPGGTGPFGGTGGDGGNGGAGGRGGGIYVAGGTVTLAGATVSGSSADGGVGGAAGAGGIGANGIPGISGGQGGLGGNGGNGGAGGRGGGIYVAGGAITLAGATVSGSSADGGSGGAAGIGGAGGPGTGGAGGPGGNGGNGGAGSPGGQGGGIYVAGGTVTLADATMSGSSADGGSGGQPGNGGPGGTGGSGTPEGNGGNGGAGGSGGNGSGGGQGGGVYVAGGTVTAISSTAAGNTGNGGTGGPAGSGGTGGSGTLDGGNGPHGNGGGGSGTGQGGAIDNAGGTVNVAADIFATGCYNATGSTWHDGGYNIGVDTSCENGGTDDLTDANLAGELAPLANYGGPTQTVAPYVGTSAVGAIPYSPTTDTTSPPFPTSTPLCPVTTTSPDQRGDPSPSGQKCDIGAVQTAVAFVQSSGTDAGNTNCTETAPCATIGYAETLVTLGDIIEVVGTITDPTTTVTVTSSQGTPASPLTIAGWTGSTPSVDGGGSTSNFSIFTVDSGAGLTLDGLTVSDGNATYGGGVDNNGTLTVMGSTFSGDFGTSGGGAIDDGFAASAPVTLTVIDSTFSGNSGVEGGAIDNGSLSSAGATATVTDSTFSGNTTTNGGGAIDNGYDAFATVTLTVTGSTFSDNHALAATGDGGAIDNADYVNGSTVTANVTNSTFSGNSTTNGGGAIDNGDHDASGDLGVTVTDSTFSGNSASDGGAIDNADHNSAGTLTATASTFSGNTATADGDAIDNGDHPGSRTGTVNVAADLFATGCATGAGSTWNDGGYNIDTDGSCESTAGGGGAHDQTDANLANELASLADNGGPTQTIALYEGTPAVGAIPDSPTTYTSGTFPTPALQLCSTTDQRGDASSGNCDIGAAQLAVPAPAVATTTTAQDATATYSAAAHSVTLTATVTSTGGTVNVGTVTFTVESGSTVIGTATPSTTVTNGAAGVSYALPAATTAGTYTIEADYSGGTGFQASLDSTHTLTVGQATPTITWNTPAAITYGTKLSGTQLDAAAAFGGSTVPGTFAYSDTNGTIGDSTVLDAGMGQALSVTFTPTDSTDYTTAAGGTTITVDQAPLTITANPASRAYGAANPTFGYTPTGFVNGDSASVLTGTPTETTSATATSPPGNYAITIGAGTLTADNYTFTFVDGTLTVGKATPTISWAAPAAITYGTKLSGTQLDATATDPTSGDTVSGTFTYTPSSGTMLDAGTGQPLSVTFTPTDSTDYADGSGSTTITVDQAPLTITANPASRAYGAANPTFGYTPTGFVNGDSASVLTGTPTETTTATATSPPGNYAITIGAGTLTADNYTFTFVDGTLTVGKATPTISWAAPAAITYGTKLSGTQLDATASVDGSFTYTPTSGTVLDAGVDQTLSATFTPTDSTDYAGTTAYTSITVNPATLTITANPASRAYGAANPTFGYTPTGFVNNDTASVLSGSPAFSTTADATSPPGSYPITVGAGTLSAANYAFTFVAGTLTVNRASTTTTLHSSANPYSLGQAITFTAGVTPVAPATGTPTGSVQFSVDGQPLGDPVSLGAGATATSVPVSALTLGDHTVSAVYSGDTDFTGSTSVSLTQVVTAVPAAPSGLSATASAGTVALTWSAPTTDGGSPVTGYEVFRGTSPGREGTTPIATVSGTSVTDTAIVGGTTYYYVVEAVNAVGPSAPSNEARVLVTGNETAGAAVAATPGAKGYWVSQPNGSVATYGDATSFGSMAGQVLNQPVVGMAATPDGQGYWLVASDGGVFAFGDAAFYGSTGGTPLNQPVVGIATTPDGKGYWLVASDGGVFAFGDAAFYGSTGGTPLNQPVVGMAATPDGQGYWLVASDGGVFAFGDAGFYGSTGGIPLNQPVVGITGTSSGHGYWLVASDGGVFAFGDAGFYGSTAANPPAQGVIGLIAFPDALGYSIVAGSGGATKFGS